MIKEVQVEVIKEVIREVPTKDASLMGGSRDP